MSKIVFTLLDAKSGNSAPLIFRSLIISSKRIRNKLGDKLRPNRTVVTKIMFKKHLYEQCQYPGPFNKFA